MRFLLIPAVLIALATSARSQDFNVDFGSNRGSPHEAFGAAGLPGFWNVVPTDEPLVDVHGEQTEVTFEGLSSVDSHFGPASGEEAALLLDGIWLGDVAWDVTFSGLADGDYVIIAYGTATHDSSVQTAFWVAGESGTGFGGAWSGSLEEGVTHGMVSTEVTGGELTVIVVGGLAWSGFCSGIQLDHLDTIPVEPATWGRIKSLY